MLKCTAEIRLAPDCGDGICTIKCDGAHTPGESHIATLKSIRGNYVVVWDFDDTDDDWWNQDVPLWGRHTDGTPRTQDEFTINNIEDQIEWLENKVDANNSPNENNNTSEEE